MKVRALATALRFGAPRNARRFLHGRSMRGAHGRQVVELIRQSGLHHFLHFAGDRYLPLPTVPPGTHHYLVVDSTWAYWRDADMPANYLNAVDRDLREAYHQMDHIFAISEHSRESLVKHYGVANDKITIIGSGRGIIAPFYGEKDYSKGIILSVAKERFEDKGGKLLFEAFQLAHQQNPALHLYLVGNPQLKQMAAGVPGVKTFSFLPLAELQELFEQAALFAMPALREPWGLVYLEALVCRTPVLGLERGAFPQITRGGEFGFAVREATPTAVAGAICDAFSDVHRLERMGINGQREILESYTWENVVDRILERIDSDI